MADDSDIGLSLNINYSHRGDAFNEKKKPKIVGNKVKLSK